MSSSGILSRLELLPRAFCFVFGKEKPHFMQVGRSSFVLHQGYFKRLTIAAIIPATSVAMAAQKFTSFNTVFRALRVAREPCGFKRFFVTLLVAQVTPPFWRHTRTLRNRARVLLYIGHPTLNLDPWLVKEHAVRSMTKRATLKA